MKECRPPKDWNSLSLSKIGKIVGGGTPNSTKKEYWDGGIMWAVPTDITKLDSNFITETRRTISPLGLENSSTQILPIGTILITSRATIGNCVINTNPMTTNQGFQNLICHKNNNNLYILYALKYFKNKLLKMSQGTTFLEISKKNMEKIEILVPSSFIEQQKIASILSNVDNLIISTQKIIEQTYLLKRELLKKLLGKGIGHKKFKNLGVIPRFIDFTIPKSWNIVKLEDISVEIKDGPMGFGLHTYDYVTSGIPILRIQNLKNLTVTKDDLKFISEEKHEELKKSQVKSLDIVISKTGILGMIGIMPKNYGPANLNQALARITLKDEKMVQYVAIFLSSKVPQQILHVVGSGRTVQTGLKLSDIKNLWIPIPPLKERQKIVSILSSNDSLIESRAQYKEKLERLKKSLMQKLLTGQIRV